LLGHSKRKYPSICYVTLLKVVHRAKNDAHNYALKVNFYGPDLSSPYFYGPHSFGPGFYCQDFYYPGIKGSSLASWGARIVGGAATPG